MSEKSRLSYVAAEVRRLDRDRFVTALFAPAERREALFGLYAFNLEVARVRELVTEPLLGRIRLQWWRDTLAALFEQTAVAHPVAEALAAAMKRFPLSQAPFDRLIDAREADLEDRPPADLPALEAYAEGTSSTLNTLALDILEVGGEAALGAARHIGIAWALTGLLRAVPYHAAAGRLYLPSLMLASHGVAQEDVLAGRTSPGLVRLGEALVQRGREHLTRARAYRSDIPRSALPALLTAPLAEAYLDSFAKAGGDPMDAHWSLTRPRPARLFWHAIRGRY